MTTEIQTDYAYHECAGLLAAYNCALGHYLPDDADTITIRSDDWTRGWWLRVENSETCDLVTDIAVSHCPFCGAKLEEHA